MTRIDAGVTNVGRDFGTVSSGGLEELFCRDLLKWEGNVRHMYRDTQGHVTTGVGNLLRDAGAAAALPWRHGESGPPATADEIRAAFKKVTKLGTGYKASYYQRASDLVLPQATVVSLMANRLEREFLPGLRRTFPGFDHYPQPAQRALVDMAYNLGVGGLAKFERLREACERGDFAAAALECNRRTSRPERNQATRELFLTAANAMAFRPAPSNQVRL
jgi:GH24 family phage-related lysozyme (muramidase)